MKPKNKSPLSLIFAAAIALSLCGQEVDKDLPTEKAGEAKGSYYHDETPLCVSHSIYSDIFIHKWLDAPHDGMEMIPKAEQDKICKTFIDHWKHEAETRTDAEKQGEALCLLGDAYIYCERWAEAEATFRKATAEGRSSQLRSRAWNGVAEAQLGAGKKSEALKTIDEFLALNLTSGGWYNGGKSRHPSFHWLVHHVKHWLSPEEWMDELKMPRYTGNMAFPEAQKANYSEKFVKAETIDLYLKGVEKTDLRVKLLAKKLKSRGFKLKGGSGRGAGYRLDITLDPKAKLQKHESYTLVASAKGCKITACDAQGVLWGIVSFIQIIDPETKKMRICEIEDWPDSPRRGYYGRNWTGNAEFAVFNKLNYITSKPHYLALAEHTPFRIFCTTEECKVFNGLGLELYGGCGNYTMDVAWPVCWRVFTAMQIDELKKWAKCGLNIYYPYDDARYWESVTYTPEERASGLLPSQTDAKRIAEIYNAVKKEYPKFKMQFCPPFYWGPRADHPYPDDRDAYLKSIAEFLPKEIDVCWTGERVGSHEKSKSSRDWFAGLIGRNPSLFQNKTGPHRYLSYVNDRTRWQDWFYEGFVTEDMAGIQKNSDTPQECPQITTLADYLWNVKGYDADRSIKRGLDNYLGKEVFETLEPAHKILCEYDRFHKYGTLIDPMQFKTVEEAEQDYQVVTSATERVKKLVVNDYLYRDGMGAWDRAVGWVGNCVAYKRAHPDPRGDDRNWLQNNEADAARQCGYKKKSRDIYLDPYAFDKVSLAYEPSKSARDWHPVDASRLIAQIPKDVHALTYVPLKSAPQKPFKAILSAYGSLSNIKVEVNGEVAHDGPIKPQVGEEGAPRYAEFELSAKFFKVGKNEIKLTNNAYGDMQVVYLVLQN